MMVLHMNFTKQQVWMKCASVVQQDTVITCDLAVYMKAKQIQWKAIREFEGTIIRMVGFHIALNFLSVIAKMYAESGLEDLLVESGVYAAGSTTALLAGKQYNINWLKRHSFVSWKAFEKWIQERPNDEQPRISMEKVYSVINDCHKAKKGPYNELVVNNERLQSEIKDAISLFNTFKQESRKKSSLFAFWDDYGVVVNILLQFIKAERTGNFIYNWVDGLAYFAIYCR
ncbi:uncharacterized protein LOC114576720 [Exaiptasia diaphana]|uniref:Uncharacterized protein n=1 Tax=Exaiptasia diaphana TaxID=2652724 RepID=A0A913YZW8_EXADI|nr:uncharacterized protein LOC114576720 [Exaiptasia diaphana]